MSLAAHQDTFLDEACAEEHAAFYLYDLDYLRKRALDIETLYGSSYSLSVFEPCNRHPAILRTIRDLGWSMTITRPLSRAGFYAGWSSVECSGCGLSLEDLRELEKYDVFLNVDSTKQALWAEEVNSERTFGLRLDVLDDPLERRGLSLSEAYNLPESIKSHVCGLHMYVGTNNMDPQAHADGLKVLLNFAENAQESGYASFEFINIGGGFGYDYQTSTDFSWAKHQTLVSALLEHQSSPLKLKMELGKSLLAPVGSFVARIEYMHERNGQWYAVLNTNSSHFPRPARLGFHKARYPFLEDGYHRAFVLGGSQLVSEAQPTLVWLAGNSHYSKDFLGYCYVPTKDVPLLSGRAVVFKDAGAYAQNMADCWLGGPSPSTMLVDGGRIVRARTQS